MKNEEIGNTISGTIVFSWLTSYKCLQLFTTEEAPICFTKEGESILFERKRQRILKLTENKSKKVFPVNSNLVSLNKENTHHRALETIF